MRSARCVRSLIPTIGVPAAPWRDDRGAVGVLGRGRQGRLHEKGGAPATLLDSVVLDAPTSYGVSGAGRRSYIERERVRKAVGAEHDEPPADRTPDPPADDDGPLQLGDYIDTPASDPFDDDEPLQLSASDALSDGDADTDETLGALTGPSFEQEDDGGHLLDTMS